MEIKELATIFLTIWYLIHIICALFMFFRKKEKILYSINANDITYKSFLDLDNCLMIG